MVEEGGQWIFARDVDVSQTKGERHENILEHPNRFVCKLLSARKDGSVSYVFSKPAAFEMTCLASITFMGC